MDIEIGFGVLNVVASPHPEGVYISALRQVVGRAVGFWGHDFATITRPNEVAPGYYQGRILIWTEIDENLPAINLTELSEITLDDAGFEIPENLGLNGRIFAYTFREDAHLIFIETRNEHGKNLSPVRAQKIFSRLLAAEILGLDSPSIDVTVVPEDDTVKRLLSIHRLDKVEIFLKRPNPDDLGEKTNELMERLVSQGLKNQDLTLSRSPDAERIQLNEENRITAEVAATNGYVKASGLEADGTRFNGSTKEYPKVIKTVIDSTTSLSVAAFRIARSYLPQNR